MTIIIKITTSSINSCSFVYLPFGDQMLIASRVALFVFECATYQEPVPLGQGQQEGRLPAASLKDFRT